MALYNHEKYVEEALDSVLKEGYGNKELIIVNDGSSDNSEEVVKNWMAKNGNLLKVEYFYRANKGICATANELVDRSNGKYIVWLPSDDMLFGNTITTRVGLLEKFEGNGKLVMVSDAKVIDSHSNVVKSSSMTEYNRGNKEKYYSDNGILEEVLINPSVSGPTILVNKNIYRKIGKYPENLQGEDWFFMQRAASMNSIIFCDIPVGCYRVHDTNTSGEHVTLEKKSKVVYYILMTFILNLSWFPGIKYKFLGIQMIIKHSLSLLKLRARIFLSNVKLFNAIG
jgi:glycosyltransferase involved in cell wall biosynthesis